MIILYAEVGQWPNALMEPVYWIRYYSSSFDQMQDICRYEFLVNCCQETSLYIFLLYATNSSQTMIRAKTFCNAPLDRFPLFDYIEFLELKLIASTYFKTFRHLDRDNDASY